MLLTAGRSWVALGVAAVVVVGVAALVVNLSLRETAAPGAGAAAVAAGQSGAADPNGRGRGADPGPIRLAPGVGPAPAPAADPPPPSRPEHIAADMQVTQQMLASLDDTLAELKRKRKYDEAAMVERKQAELRAQLSQSQQRLAGLRR